jgi:hypothetical protein
LPQLASIQAALGDLAKRLDRIETVLAHAHGPKR